MLVETQIEVERDRLREVFDPVEGEWDYEVTGQTEKLNVTVRGEVTATATEYHVDFREAVDENSREFVLTAQERSRAEDELAEEARRGDEDERRHRQEVVNFLRGELKSASDWERQSRLRDAISLLEAA